MIVDTQSAITITNELGQSRTVHPDGRQESIEIQGVVFSVTSKRDGDQLTMDYRVDQNREIRYTYAATASPSQLMVYVQFLDHGKGEQRETHLRARNRHADGDAGRGGVRDGPCSAGPTGLRLVRISAQGPSSGTHDRRDPGRDVEPAGHRLRVEPDHD